MTNDKKQQFIGKWSSWFIFHKHAKEMMVAFERELDEIIADEREKMNCEHTNQTPTHKRQGMTEAEFEKAKAGHPIERNDGTPVECKFWEWEKQERKLKRKL